MSVALKPGAQLWAMVEGYATPLGYAYSAAFAPDVRGWVWPVRWRDLDGGTGLDSLGRSLDWAHTCGALVIPRITLKSYMDTVSPPSEKWRLVPADVAADPAIYGGEYGGVVRGYSSGKWCGWTVNVVNPTVMARLRDTLKAMVQRFGQHPAFGGIMTDEVLWGVAGAGPWPTGTCAEQWYCATIEYAAHIASLVGARNTYAIINYLDGPNREAMIPHMVGAMNRMGVNVAVSDIFRDPEDKARFQPVYRMFPLAGQRTIAHCVGNSETNSPAEADKYLDQCARMGTDIVAVTTTGGATGANWAAYRSAWTARG